MDNPDARIDPNGKTFRYLIMYLDKSSASTSKPPQLISTSPIVLSGLNDIQVSYSSDIQDNRKIVSIYSISLIKIALKECGMNHAVITSTLRIPDDQEAIMYKNAKINLAKQRSLYGKNGDEILDIYEENIKKEKSETIKLKKEKIEHLLERDKKVSNHCITIDSFKKRNTFNIGLNSTKNKSKNFDKEKLSQAFSDLKTQGYIKNFIDETMKSNSCWHLEIVPHTKDLNTYGKTSMLLPVKYINGTYA